MAHLSSALSFPLGGDIGGSGPVFPPPWPIGAINGEGFQPINGSVTAGAIDGGGGQLVNGAVNIGAVNGGGGQVGAASGPPSFSTFWPIGAINGEDV